jgi:hypothetical protein
VGRETTTVGVSSAVAGSRKFSGKRKDEMNETPGKNLYIEQLSFT